MKTLRHPLLLALGLLLCRGVATAQTDYSARTASSKLSVGAGVGLGISVPSGSLADSLEAAPGIAVRGGLNANYPINRVVGVMLNAGLDYRTSGVKVNKAVDSRRYTASYFFVEPGVTFSSFMLSLNVGLPMGGTEPDPLSSDATATRDVADDALATMIEPRLGAKLVLMDTREYWLGLTISAGFPVSTLYDEAYRTANNIGDDQVPNTRLLNGHLGLTWQFAIQ